MNHASPERKSAKDSSDLRSGPISGDALSNWPQGEYQHGSRCTQEVSPRPPQHGSRRGFAGIDRVWCSKTLSLCPQKHQQNLLQPKKLFPDAGWNVQVQGCDLHRNHPRRSAAQVNFVVSTRRSMDAARGKKSGGRGAKARPTHLGDETYSTRMDPAPLLSRTVGPPAPTLA